MLGVAPAVKLRLGDEVNKALPLAVGEIDWLTVFDCVPVIDGVLMTEADVEPEELKSSVALGDLVRVAEQETVTLMVFVMLPVFVYVEVRDVEGLIVTVGVGLVVEIATMPLK